MRRSGVPQGCSLCNYIRDGELSERCAYDATGTFETCDEVWHELADNGPHAARETWERHLDVAWAEEGER